MDEHCLDSGSAILNCSLSQHPQMAHFIGVQMRFVAATSDCCLHRPKAVSRPSKDVPGLVSMHNSRNAVLSLGEDRFGLNRFNR